MTNPHRQAEALKSTVQALAIGSFGAAIFGDVGLGARLAFAIGGVLSQLVVHVIVAYIDRADQRSGG